MMPDKKLKVTERFARRGADGIRIVCTMSDGSQWSSNSDGKGWRKELPSTPELEESFNLESFNLKT